MIGPNTLTNHITEQRGEIQSIHCESTFFLNVKIRRIKQISLTNLVDEIVI